MATNKQLQQWLSRFPDDTEINVVTTKEWKGGYYSSIDAYTDSVELPDVDMSTLKGWYDFPNVVFDVNYDYDKECCTGVKSITLGKAHND